MSLLVTDDDSIQGILFQLSPILLRSTTKISFPSNPTISLIQSKSSLVSIRHSSTVIRQSFQAQGLPSKPSTIPLMRKVL